MNPTSPVAAAKPDLRLCPLCGATATLVHRGHPGYQAPARFDIYGCTSCEARFVEPLESAGDIYDLVYRNIEHVPGYARYARFARTVAKRHDPLGYLAREEDSYWAVERYLSSHLQTTRPRLLEIGSGLGYLTYAISRRGFDIQGLDISSVAVDRARQRFGDLYRCADAFALAASPGAGFDAVVMTELIEHIPRLMDMLKAAFALVRPGGDLVVTTPNRSASAPHALWDTDAPPVHVWWLSERSMAVIAERLGARLTLIDFSAFNRAHPTDIDHGTHMAGPTVPPVFAADGSLLATPGAGKPVLRRIFFALGLDRLRALQEARQARREPPTSRRKTLCAILRKPAANLAAAQRN